MAEDLYPTQGDAKEQYWTCYVSEGQSLSNIVGLDASKFSQNNHTNTLARKRHVITTYRNISFQTHTHKKPQKKSDFGYNNFSVVYLSLILE